MTETAKWRDGVKVLRAGAIQAAMPGPRGTGRATAVDFTGLGGRATWIGVVNLQPGHNTGMHHHGRHEVAIYVVKGRSQIRWGDRLDFAAEIGPGDFVYFAPHVPHQELNLDAGEAAEFVVVRSDNERIVVNLEGAPVERPELISS